MRKPQMPLCLFLSIFYFSFHKRKIKNFVNKKIFNREKLPPKVNKKKKERSYVEQLIEI